MGIPSIYLLLYADFYPHKNLYIITLKCVTTLEGYTSGKVLFCWLHENNINIAIALRSRIFSQISAVKLYK